MLGVHALVLVALDTETFLITEMDKAPKLVCVSVAWENDTTGLYRWCDAKEHVAKILSHHTMVGANIAYDCAVMARQWPDLIPLIWKAYEEDRIWDIQVGQKLKDIAEGAGTKHPYNLAFLAEGYLGVTLDKNTWRLRYNEFHDIPIEMWPEGARKYPLDDAITTLRIAQLIFPYVGPDIWRQSRHAWWAHLMGLWGVQTDPVRVAKLKAKLVAERDTAWKDLIAAGIIRKNGVQNVSATRARVVEAYTRLGLVVPRTDPSKSHPEGQVAYSDEVCRDAGDPLLEICADYGSIRKQLSTDVPNLERGEIHTRYDSLKETGRMGSGGKDNTSPTGTAFNLTNLPRAGGVRECFIPRAGKIFWDADYAALEAYTGAQCCLTLIGESSLADLLKKDEDYHIHTASAYLGIAYAEGMARKAGGEAYIKTLRQFAKIFNYSLAGGGGQKMIYGHAQTELKADGKRDLAKALTREQSDRLWMVWRQRYPEWIKYFARTGAMTREGGYVMEQLFSGRLRMVEGKRAYTEMNNGYFQGLGADAAKDAGWRIARECYDPTYSYSPLFGNRIVIFGHDSFTGECDPEGAHEAAMRVKMHMEAVSEIWTPDLQLRTEPALASCLSKGAASLYDQHGRLMVWSPTEEETA